MAVQGQPKKSLKELNGINFSELKNKLSEQLIKLIVPIGKKIKELKQDTKRLKLNGSTNKNWLGRNTKLGWKKNLKILISQIILLLKPNNL